MASKRKILKKVNLGLLPMPAKWRSVAQSPKVANTNPVAEAAPAVVEAPPPLVETPAPIVETPVVKKVHASKPLRKASVVEKAEEAPATTRPKRRARRSGLKTEK